MKNKAFTLIELLAVIIILGILMLIAIPSVTSYINNSRKETYVDTIKELLNGARTLVNSGDLDVYDHNKSYYLPYTCIEMDKGAKSPYGNLDEAYIVVSYRNDNFDYYYVGKDEKGIGIPSITNSDVISKDTIKDNVDFIDKTIGVDGTNMVSIFNSDCSDVVETKQVTNTVSGGVDYVSMSHDNITSVSDRIYWALQDTNGNGKKDRLVLSDKEVTGELSGSFAGDTWFEYKGQVPWIRGTGSDNLSKDVTNIVIDGILAPAYTSCWFMEVGLEAPTFYADLSNLDMRFVTKSNSMFSDIARNHAESFILKGLDTWDVSNIQTFNFMFMHVGTVATTWDIGDLSNWNTSSVTSMVGMFLYSGGKIPTLKLNVENWDVSNVTNMKELFRYTGQYVKDFNLDLSHWDVSNVTEINGIFSGAAYNSETFKLNLNNWNTSKVAYANNPFEDTAPTASVWEVTIPKTNGNGITNTPTNWYGKTTSISINGREPFIVAN